MPTNKRVIDVFIWKSISGIYTRYAFPCSSMNLYQKNKVLGDLLDVQFSHFRDPAQHNLPDPMRRSASIRLLRISLMRVRWPSPLDHSQSNSCGSRRTVGGRVGCPFLLFLIGIRAFFYRCRVGRGPEIHATAGQEAGAALACRDRQPGAPCPAFGTWDSTISRC